MLPGLEHHPHARAVLEPALPPDGDPSHAYLFRGPAGSGKRSVARAFAAALLADGAPDPALARRRVEHGTHPDLTWVAPSGAAEMLVSDIDEPVVAAAARTPFEARRRVFVIERADTMNDATANRMLKTLEEPPAYAHLILLTDRPGELLPTISSRCQHVRFDALPSDELARRLEQRGVPPQTALACARLALGDGERALAYALGNGPALRAAGEALARGAGERPWMAMLELAKSEGELVVARLAEQHAEQLELAGKQEKQRLKKEHEERTRRAERRAKAATLDRGLALAGLWYRDAACIAEGAPELVHAVDRIDELAADRRPPAQLRAALELVEDTRSRLAVNVTEELALEALSYRLAEIGPSDGSRS